MADRTKKHTTAFVTGPIALLVGAALVLVLASLLIGGREADRLALTRQRETIENALVQHGRSLARELRVQTVWSEAFEKTRARDQVWMRAFYGIYLDELFGYDRIYVLSGADKPLYGFAQGRDRPSADFESIAPGLKDLIAAVRDPEAMPAKYDVITTPIALGDTAATNHRAVADVRNIEGTPATVVISTIVPDRQPRVPLESRPLLLVAIEDLDKRFLGRLGKNFGFRDLDWVRDHAPPGFSTDAVKALDGADVGTLAWRKDQPGWEFVRRVAFGLIIALVLLAVLAILLMRWSRRQARELLASEEQARLAAQTDALTGLPNRLVLSETLSQWIDRAKWGSSTLGLLSIDLDRFKEINDDFGQAAADAVLLAVAERLRGLLGPDSLLLRTGGDEFVILALGVGAGGVSELALGVVECLAAPIDVGGAHVLLTASVGHTLAPRDGDRDDDLVRRAELALAKAKEADGGTAVEFVPEMDLELSRRRALESALRAAIAKEAIDVAYQPIMDPTGSRIVAVEALARFTDPLLGPVPTSVFVPLAEETGLVQRLGEIVLRRAVMDGLAWPGIGVAVNVSGAQIHHGDVVSAVRNVLSDFEFPPARLEIEITESVLLADERHANEQIKALQRLGVRVALDDFGSGFSSLLYLRKFGFDKLKIDRSFVDEICHSDDSRLILASIIQLGLDLKMTITAEGVETLEQHRWLRSSGCHQLQGYLFSRALTAEQLKAFIASHRPIAAAG